jgi:hypothetical protein
MSENAKDVAEYYQQRAEAEREYVRVYAARPAKEGDAITVNAGGFAIQSSIEEDGYTLSAYSGAQSSTEEFLSAEDFKTRTEDAGSLYPSLPREDVSAEEAAALRPVKKGKTIVVNVGLPIQTKAECDGFLYKTSGGDIFLSNYSVSAAFNYVGRKEQTHEELVVRKKDEPMLKGIILEEDVTFAFKSGPYEAKKGSFVTPNPDDEDGYTAFPPGFAIFGLRRNQSDEVMAAIADVRTDSHVEVGKPLKFKK